MSAQIADPESPEVPVAANPAALQTAALRLLAWAHRRGLLTPDAHHPGDEYEDPVLSNATDGGVALLRSKFIRAIGTNFSVGEISVYLLKAVPGSRLVLALPTHCDGYMLRYYQGSPDEVTPNAIAQAANPCAIHVVQGVDFYTCGSSISVGNSRGAGTLGCLVRDAAGVMYGLSNNHVSGACNYAPVGLPIIAPGVLDVGPFSPHPFTIGTHERQLQMAMGDPTTVDTSLNQDAAVFRITCVERLSSMQQNSYDTPALTMPLLAGMRVKKVGRSSGFTEGVVRSAVVGPLSVGYSASEHNFTGRVYFERLFVVQGITDRFSEAGDSGSLVVHDAPDGRAYAVGIVVAGQTFTQAPGGKTTLIMPIQPILASLNATLVSGHNM